MTRTEIDLGAIERQLDDLLTEIEQSYSVRKLARVCKQLLDYIKLVDQARRDGVK